MPSATRNANLFAVIPLKRLDRAKSRLSGALTPTERVALALNLAGRTLNALREAGVAQRIVVVSPDPAVLAWAETRGAIALAQPGVGLNAGLELARDWAIGHGADSLLITLGDLPLLTADEVRHFVAMTRLYERVIALAPDRTRDGTNLQLERPVALAPFAYGRGSFARRQRLAKRLGIPTVEFSAPGAAFDVDTPADLGELIARGIWSPTSPPIAPTPRSKGNDRDNSR